MIAYVCVFNKAVNGFEQIRQYQFNATAFRTRKVLLVRGLERGILKASGSQLSATKTLSTVMILRLGCVQSGPTQLSCLYC